MTMTLEHISRDLRAYSAQSGTSLERGECAEIADVIDGAIRERDRLRGDVDGLRDCAERAEAELAALKARIAGSVELHVGDPTWSDGTLADMEGKRVRLLVDEPAPPMEPGSLDELRIERGGGNHG